MLRWRKRKYLEKKSSQTIWKLLKLLTDMFIFSSMFLLQDRGIFSVSAYLVFYSPPSDWGGTGSSRDVKRLHGRRLGQRDWGKRGTGGLWGLRTEQWEHRRWEKEKKFNKRFKNQFLPVEDSEARSSPCCDVEKKKKKERKMNLNFRNVNNIRTL